MASGYHCGQTTLNGGSALGVEGGEGGRSWQRAGEAGRPWQREGNLFQIIPKHCFPRRLTDPVHRGHPFKESVLRGGRMQLTYVCCYIPVPGLGIRKTFQQPQQTVCWLTTLGRELG